MLSFVGVVCPYRRSAVLRRHVLLFTVLVLLQADSSFGQVILRETIVLTPQHTRVGQDSLLSSEDSVRIAKMLLSMRVGKPHVLGIPQERWIAEHPKQHSLLRKTNLI